VFIVIIEMIVRLGHAHSTIMHPSATGRISRLFLIALLNTLAEDICMAILCIFPES
jgi:hypothetical protein